MNTKHRRPSDESPHEDIGQPREPGEPPESADDQTQPASQGGQGMGQGRGANAGQERLDRSQRADMGVADEQHGE